MANLNEQEIRKLKKGELAGIIALIGCAVVCISFIVVYTIASVKNIYGLKLAYIIWSPIALAIFAGAAAFCNLKYGKAIDRHIKSYVQEVFVENALLMRPERSELTYYIEFEGTTTYIKVNNFKEKIVFDFSAFNKLSASRRANITVAIVERLETTFCRLAERGGKYTSVTYTVNRSDNRSKAVSIIEKGAPDKRAYKNYLKNK